MFCKILNQKEGEGDGMRGYDYAALAGRKGISGT
jgi:hypothetical protein